MNHNNHDKMLSRLKRAQDDDSDNRDKVREAHLFVDKRSGQWEQHWWSQNKGKPRYTFDLTNPIVDQISGEMVKSDFDIVISPAGGQATKALALTFDGLIRNIESISQASIKVYEPSSRAMIVSGMDGWRVSQKFVDSNSFDQDLIIEKVHNWVDRVWFGFSEEQDKSDCEEAWLLTGLSKEKYKEKFPNRSGRSLDSGRKDSAYFNVPDLIMTGEYYFIKKTEHTLILMSNGNVYEDNADFKKVQDELAMLGVVEVKRRVREKRTAWMRKFDIDGWLENKANETVFEWIPLIPVYANFKINDNKVIYWGAVEKLLDPQRVFNYSLSREIEEGALAPRAKYWMTKTQAIGHEDKLSSLNVNADPVQFYNADPAVRNGLPPEQQGGAQINPGLRNISENMRAVVGQTAGMFAANMGDNPGLQSGIAIDKLQSRGTTGTTKYYSSMEVAQCHTSRILVNAIPKVYKPGRQVRLLKDDGSDDTITIGEEIVDRQTQETVVLNDLSIGTYDITCSSGPSFKSKQAEIVSTIVEIGQVQPEVLGLGSDILINNISAPGTTQLAERLRKKLFESGAIPDSQLTPEEKQKLEAARKAPKEPSPQMVLAQAEQTKADAELLVAQNEQAKLQVDIGKKQADIEAVAKEQTRKDFDTRSKNELAEDRFDAEQITENKGLQLKQNKLIIDQMSAQAEMIKAIGDTLEKISSAQLNEELSRVDDLEGKDEL